MKELILDEIKKLESRVRRLEDVTVYDDRFAAMTKQSSDSNKSEIHELKTRLVRLERNQVLTMADLQRLGDRDESNNSRETIESESAGKPRATVMQKQVDGIQRRLLSPPSPTNSNGGVAFYAYMSAILHSPTAQHVLIFDVVKTNIGDAYHPTTGVFMVPETGVYVFTWTFRIGADQDHSIELIINRETVGVVYLKTIGGVEAEETGIVATHANAGDDVFVRTHSTYPIGLGHYIQSNQYGRSSFAGWKIF